MEFAKAPQEEKDPKKKAMLDFASQKGVAGIVQAALVNYYCDFGLGEKYGGKSPEWKAVREKVVRLCSWLRANENRLLAEFKSDVKEGRIKLKISSERAQRNAPVIFMTWLSARYLVEMENPGGDFFKPGDGKPPKYFPLVVKGNKEAAVGEEVRDKRNEWAAKSGFLQRKEIVATILPWESLGADGKDAHLASRMIAAFNGGLHENAHAYPRMFGKDEIVSEIGTQIAVMKYGLPAFFEFAYPESHFNGTRDIRGVVKKSGIPEEQKLGLLYSEYLETALAPYIFSYLKEKNGKEPSFHEFISGFSEETDEFRGSLQAFGITDTELVEKMAKVLEGLFPSGMKRKNLPASDDFPARFFDALDSAFPERKKLSPLPDEFYNRLPYE